MLQTVAHRVQYLIFVFSLLGLVSCGGNGPSGNEDGSSVEIPETAQAIPGSELPLVQAPPTSTDSGPLPELSLIHI